MYKQFWVVLLICAVLVAGCGKNRSQSSSEEKPADTQQTNAGSTASNAAPQEQPTAPASTPPAATPANKAPAAPSQPEQKAIAAKAAPSTPNPVVLPIGTAVVVRTLSAINSSSSKPGQTFEVTLAQPVVVGSATVVPAGSPATGKVVQSASAGRIKGEGVLSLALISVSIKGHAYPVITDPVTKTAQSRGKRSATMIGGGAGAGALIGGLAGGGKGAAIGALAGGAAGTAGATMTGKRDVVVPAETVLNFRLAAPLKLQ